jgi:hypothetical protein
MEASMDIPIAVWIAGGITVLVVVAVVVVFFVLARRVNLTRSGSPDQKPEWMRTTPPPETVTATQEDGEGIALYDYDRGERVAAPFAEQIEDILRARLRSDPALAGVDVDLGTAPDGGLEIWVNGERYTDANLLPDGRLRQILQEAIKSWEQTREGSHA